MKKLFVVALTCVCCMAIALPAMADVKLGGMITLDYNYIDRNDARSANTNGAAIATNGFPGILPNQVNMDDGYNITRMEFPMPLNFLQVSYVSKDKVVSGLLRWRLGSNHALGSTGDINLYYAYINYKFSDMFSMRFGRQDTILAPFSPSQLSGYDSWGHIVGIGWGNQNNTSLLDGITAELKFNPMISLKLGIFDNDTDPAVGGAEPISGATNAVPAGTIPPTVREENIAPRFDISLPITWNWLTVIPSFSYLSQSYDSVLAGNEDSIDIWAGAVSARAGFGPFSITGEMTWGKNMGAGNYNADITYLALNGLGTGIGGPKAYVTAMGNSQIEDEDNLLWFIDLAFKFGPATLHGIYGQSHSETAPNQAAAVPSSTDFDIKSQMYGLACPITIGGGFTIRPELFFYDYDDDATWGGRQNLDLGKEAVLAVLFQLYF